MGRARRRDPDRALLTERVALRVSRDMAVRLITAAVARGIGESDIARAALERGLAAIEHENLIKPDIAGPVEAG